MNIHRVLILSLGLVISFCTAAEITRGPYLQLAREDGITLVWRTDKAMQNPRVAYQKEGDKKLNRCAADAILPRGLTGQDRLSKAPEGTTQYEATIRGLEPGTTYRYLIFDGDTELSKSDVDHHFTTHPPAGKATPTRMWVVGDSGTGEYHQLLVHRAMQIYTKETKRPLDFYLHVGDMAYGQGTDDQFQKKFFEPYEKTLRNKVCWASLGNHEGSSSDGKKTKGLFSMRLSARPKAKPAASHPAASLSTRSIMAISM
jgi:hypothetical protein